jgi:ABC-type antimicrobial peptide transport system ATPase subunit
MAQADDGQFASDKRLRNIFQPYTTNMRVRQMISRTSKRAMRVTPVLLAERVVEQIRTTFRVLGQLPHLRHDGTTLTGGRLTVLIRHRCS